MKQSATILPCGVKNKLDIAGYLLAIGVSWINLVRLLVVIPCKKLNNCACYCSVSLPFNLMYDLFGILQTILFFTSLSSFSVIVSSIPLCNFSRVINNQSF